jgi:hypothetical protein
MNRPTLPKTLWQKSDARTLVLNLKQLRCNARRLSIYVRRSATTVSIQKSHEWVEVINRPLTRLNGWLSQRCMEVRNQQRKEKEDIERKLEMERMDGEGGAYLASMNESL